MDDVAPSSQRTLAGWSERWSPLGGLLFVVGVFGLLFVGSDAGSSTGELVRYVEEGQAKILIWQVFAFLSLGLMSWYVSGLYARVSRMGSHTAPTLVLLGGATFTILFFLALTIWNAPLFSFNTGLASNDTRAAAYHLVESIGWLTMGGAGVGAAVLAVAASVAALRSGAVPAWLGWTGVVVGCLAAATALIVGFIGWILWFLVSSILMLVKRP